jgi:hypothetical protein
MIEEGWTELIGDVRNIEKRKTVPFEPTPAEEALGITRFKKFLRMFNGKYRIDKLMLPDELFLFSIEDSYLHLHNLKRYERIIKMAARKKDESDMGIMDRLATLSNAFKALADAGLLNKSDLSHLEMCLDSKKKIQ